MSTLSVDTIKNLAGDERFGPVWAGATASTSGTAIEFSSIPSWVKKITVVGLGVSTNGTAQLIVQIGDSGGYETTGYAGNYTGLQAGTLATTSWAGEGAEVTSTFVAAGVSDFTMTFHNIDGNKWVANGLARIPSASYLVVLSIGNKELSGTLDRIRLTTDGADTFDAGTVNVMYE